MKTFLVACALGFAVVPSYAAEISNNELSGARLLRFPTSPRMPSGPTQS